MISDFYLFNLSTIGGAYQKHRRGTLFTNLIEGEDVIVDIPEEIEAELRATGFSKEGKDPRELTRFLIDKVYPYRMKGSHPRYFCFIPSAISPYSVFGDFINSMYNPYGGGYTISKGTANLERNPRVDGIYGWL